MSLERPVDFSEQIEHFRAAVHGEDVRGDLIEIAEVLEEAVNEQLIDVDGTLTQSGQGADAKTVGDILFGGSTHTNRTPTPPVHYTGTITSLLDLPVHCWKLVQGGDESSPADGTLCKLLASQDEAYFPWLSVFGENTYYRLTRKKTLVTGGSQFIIEGLTGNPRFFGVLPVPEEGVTQTAADITWFNRSITSDFGTPGAAASAAGVGDAIYGAGESHDEKRPRIMTQFSGMADLNRLDDMSQWTVGTISGSKFRTLQPAFPDLAEIPNDDTTFFLEKKGFNLGEHGRYSNQYLLYRAQRTTIWAGWTSINDRPGDGDDPDEYVQTINWNRIVQIGGAPADGQVPTYVSLGASTVWGAVKTLDTTAASRSAYRFPVYVANALHMVLHDLSIGDVGFLSRGSDGTRPNFMDAIYNSANAAAFQSAGLISIVFGYGNDGASYAQLPVGSYDDYYPYDAEDYHPAGLAGVSEMRSKGATLFGCLNWCIKYIGEHFPKAQLVLVFAAPSQNKDRTVTMTSQTGGVGTAPYKLTFADPYGDDATTTEELGCRAIGQELQKLQKALSIPIIDTYNDVGNAFSVYQTNARGADHKYAVFSTTGDSSASYDEWVWNRHPNDDGYKLYARYIAGLIVRQYFH